MASAESAVKEAGEQAAEQPLEQERLESFRAEIQSIKDGEMAKKAEWEKRGETGKAYNPHFDYIDSSKLTELEADVYEKFQNKTLTLKEFGIARNHAREKVPEDEKCFTNPRINFYEYLSNQMLTKEWVERWDKERKK